MAEQDIPNNLIFG